MAGRQVRSQHIKRRELKKRQRYCFKMQQYLCRFYVSNKNKRTSV